MAKHLIHQYPVPKYVGNIDKWSQDLEIWLERLQTDADTATQVIVDGTEVDISLYDHDLLINAKGLTWQHTDIDNHIDLTTVHFLIGDIDHADIAGIGTHTHAQIDSHVDLTTVHFLIEDIDHADITGIGTNAHSVIDSHLSNAEIHLPIRFSNIGDTSSLTPEPDDYDMYCVYGLNSDILVNNYSTSTPAQGKKLIVRIKDDGTARAITYGNYYRSTCSVALPATTTISKTLYLGFIWSATDTKWDLVAVSEEQ